MWRCGSLPTHSSHYYYYHYYLYYYYCCHQTTIESSTSTWKPQKSQGINGNPDHHTHQWTPFNLPPSPTTFRGRGPEDCSVCVWSKPSEEELRLSLLWFFFFPSSFSNISSFFPSLPLSWTPLTGPPFHFSSFPFLLSFSATSESCSCSANPQDTHTNTTVSWKEKNEHTKQYLASLVADSKFIYNLRGSKVSSMFWKLCLLECKKNKTKNKKLQKVLLDII